MSKWKQLILSQYHAGLDIYYKSMLKANKPDFTPANIQQAVAKISFLLSTRGHCVPSSV